MLSRKTIGGLALMGAISAGLEFWPKGTGHEAIARTTVPHPTQTQTHSKVQNVLESTEGIPCQEDMELFFSVEGDASIGEDEKEERRVDFKRCMNNLNPEGKGLLRSLELEKQAERDYKTRCPEDKEEECDELENDFVVGLEDLGIQGWSWSDDFQFAYDQNGWTKAFVSAPGFELQLPNSLDGHDDFIHLETDWSGSEPVVSFYLVHVEEENQYATGFPEDIIADDVSGETLKEIQGLWSQANEQ